MAKKYKTTGCARFFLALIIIAPIAFFGAAYINGENGFDKLKELVRWESKSNTMDNDNYSETTDISILRETIKAKDRRINELVDEVNLLKKEISDQRQKIKALEGQE